MDIKINTKMISYYIKTNSLTIKEFCSRCGISATVYYRVTGNKDCYMTALVKIAKVINVQLYEFFA